MSILRRASDEKPSYTLSLRQRLSLVIGTGLSAQTMTEMNDENIDYQFLLSNGIRAPLLKAAKFTPLQLKARGVATANHFKSLEFSTLDLVDASFCGQCLAAYGADELLADFLTTPQEAVALAGSPAMGQLGVDIGTLLVLCAGCPGMACGVIEQSHPRGGCLLGVAPETLLDTGLRSKTLTELGFTAQSLSIQTAASLHELKKLGF